MERYMYLDETNNSNDPFAIEHNLGDFEREISELIKAFINRSDIILTIQETEKLRLFMAILSFRSKRTKEFFSGEMRKETKAMYLNYQPNGDMETFWKRNLGEIVKCRSAKEVINSNKIDLPMKVFFARDIADFYMCVLERRGREDFIISDAITSLSGDSIGGLAVPIYYFYPISPDKMLLMVTNHIDFVAADVRRLDKAKLKGPKRTPDGVHLKYHAEKIYEADVKSINRILWNEAAEGIVYIDPSRVAAAKAKTQ